MSDEVRITPRPIREEQAWQEIGHTTFAPGVRTVLIVGFLVFIVSVPLIQLFMPRASYAALAGHIETSTPTAGTRVTATIDALSSPPDADGVYSDFLMQVRLRDVTWPNDQQGPTDLTTNVLGMRARIITSAAGVAPGDMVELWLDDWQTVAEGLAGINGSELEDAGLDSTVSFFADDLRRLGDDTRPSGADFLSTWSGKGSDLPPEHRIPMLTGVQTAISKADGALGSLLDGNGHLAKRINLYETALDDSAWTTLALKSPVQGVMSAIGVGNEKAALGRDGWLFYIPGVHSLTGPGFLDPAQLRSRERWEGVQPDPRKAIIDFRDQLAARNIELVLVLAPVKPSIHPEFLSSRFNESSPAIRNRSMATFLADMDEADIHVVDPTAMLRERAATAPQYLATDTHWRPEAMQAVAAMTASQVSNFIDAMPAPDWQQHSHTVSQVGDIGTMLELPGWQVSVSEESAVISALRTGNGAPWRSESRADVLVLGDSFTNIFRVAAMGWGAEAGFAEQLAWELQRPVDVLARNDGGAHASRQMLVDALVADPWRLSDKRVVVWEVTERELALGDWKMLTLPSAPDEPRPDTGPAGLHVASVDEAPAAWAALVERAGDQPVIAGSDDWLHLRSELQFLASEPFWGEQAESPKTDPFASIVDLHNRLSELDIQLILAPAPPRAVVYADTLFDELPTDEHGLPLRLDPTLQAFYEALREEGVTVVDTTDAFIAARQNETELGRVCCQQDTHWSPRGLALTASAVYAALTADGEPEWFEDLDYADISPAEPQALTYVGDMADRLEGFAGQQTTDMITVINNGEEPLTFDSSSPILLLADSHGLVFSSGKDMHSEHAGFGEHLSLEFGLPIDLMAQKGSGDAVRRNLARRFIQKPNEAEGKRVLIYTFAARTFTTGRNWTPVPLSR